MAAPVFRSVDLGNNSLVGTNPAGTADGDTLVAWFNGWDQPSRVIGAPSGWTPHGRDDSADGETVQSFTRVWHTGDPTTHTWTDSFAAFYHNIIVAAFSGGDTTTPYDTGTANHGGAGTITATGVTTAVAHELLLVFMGTDDGSAPATPSGMTPIATNSDDGSFYRICTLDVASAGATGDKTSTSGSPWVAIVDAIRPAGGGGGGGAVYVPPPQWPVPRGQQYSFLRDASLLPATIAPTGLVWVPDPVLLRPQRYPQRIQATAQPPMLIQPSWAPDLQPAPKMPSAPRQLPQSDPIAATTTAATTAFTSDAVAIIPRRVSRASHAPETPPPLASWTPDPTAAFAPARSRLPQPPPDVPPPIVYTPPVGEVQALPRAVRRPTPPVFEVTPSIVSPWTPDPAQQTPRAQLRQVSQASATPPPMPAWAPDALAPPRGLSTRTTAQLDTAPPIVSPWTPPVFTEPHRAQPRQWDAPASIAPIVTVTAVLYAPDPHWPTPRRQQPRLLDSTALPTAIVPQVLAWAPDSTPLRPFRAPVRFTAADVPLAAIVTSALAWAPETAARRVPATFRVATIDTPSPLLGSWTPDIPPTARPVSHTPPPPVDAISSSQVAWAPLSTDMPRRAAPATRYADSSIAPPPLHLLAWAPDVYQPSRQRYVATFLTWDDALPDLPNPIVVTIIIGSVVGYVLATPTIYGQATPRLNLAGSVTGANVQGSVVGPLTVLHGMVELG